jgi:hypothetical protein
VSNAVVLGQPLVEERVIRAQKVEHAAILAQDAVDEELCLAAKRLPEVFVEIREQAHVGSHRVEIPQMQPLRREVVHQRARAAVGEHATDLPLQDCRLAQPSGAGQIEQLIVGNAAPQEKGEARRQLEIADPIRRVRRSADRVPFDAEQELRTDQHGRQGHLDARLEAAFRAGFPIELERPLEIGVGDRPPIGSPHQRRQHFFRRL